MKKDSWNPAQYDKFKNERSQPFFDLMDLIHGNIKNGKAIDLGCGTGELTKILHSKLQLKETVGIDNSEKMLEKASGVTGVTFEKRNLEAFEGKYDLIFSNAALHWCEDHPKLFKRIRDHLNAFGQIAIQIPMNHDYPTHTIAAEVAGKYFRSYPLLKAEEYSKLLFDLGFSDQKVLIKVYPHVLESRDGVIEWVKGTLLTHYEKVMPADDYKKFKEAYRKKLFKVLPDEKPFFYPFKRILIWAHLK
jgi:trans-aconitate 2-methyltransferase